MRAQERPAVGHAPDPLDIPVKVALARLTHGISPASIGLAYADWLGHVWSSPAHQSRLALSGWRKSMAWWQYLSTAWHGDCPACVEPTPNDRRFAAADWRRAPFNSLSQAFLLQEQWCAEAMTQVRGVSRHHEEVAWFITRQWLDMLSPSNFPWANPQVLGETARRGGMNLVHGATNWWRDALAVLSDGQPRGVDAFKPGVGVALTPGRVVFRNRLIELMQYDATTPDVMAEPILVIPSWIMKYYILDLTPESSLVKYLVDRGHTVFVVSWENPGTADRELGMDDYLTLGLLDAVEEVRKMRPRIGIHAAGYCLGGTLLAIAAAVLARRPHNPLKTVSILAGQVDFNEPGELGLFIDESQITFLEGLMAERGYLDGRQMAGAFQLINSKDLVWSKLVHEYLMGARTPMTALRAWNADATRLPARMHSEYLRKLYMDNDLAEGRYEVAGQTARLGAIRRPLFVVATEQDHVSPWESVYRLHQLTHAPVQFVLASGGHNVGIVSPPAGPLAYPGATYRWAEHAPGEAPDDAQAWAERAATQAGSWWPRWVDWLAAQSTGRRVPPPALHGLLHHGQPLAAPGLYVHRR